MKKLLHLLIILSNYFIFAQIPTCPMDNFGGNIQININSISPSILTNTTTGEAPLYVYVSASQTTSPDTQNPYYDIEYSWDFGDVTSGNEWFTHPVDGSTINANNNQKGPEAAYLYRAAGIYIITLWAKVWNGTDFITTATSVNITVNPWSGSTRYFDPTNGNDANSGTSPATALQTWDALTVWLNGGNNRASYIKRGEIMPVTTTLATKKSDLRIGAYGSGSNPVLLASASMANNRFINANGTNAAITNHYYADLDFDLNNSAGAAFFGYSDATGSLSNVVFDNCMLRNGNNESMILTTGSGPKSSILLWNCSFDMNQGAKQNFVPYNTPYCAVIGGQQIGGNGNAILDHHMYINQCDHTLIRWVNFGATVNRNFCLNMNSPSFSSDTQYTLIDGCNITGTNNGIDFSNSNNDNSGHFTKSIVQNSAIHDLNTGNQGFGVFGYSIKDICIRYNRFYNNRVADINILDTDNTYLAYRNWFYTSAIYPNTSVNLVNGQKGSFIENVFVTEANANSLHFSGDLNNTFNWNIDFNEYWYPNISNPFYNTSTSSSLNFNQWQTLGYDVNGQNANPFFPNPTAGDFGQLPTVDFSFSVTNGTAFFTNLTTNNPINWSIFYDWNFGDGNSSTIANSSNTYQNNGTYLVTFNARNRCGTSSSLQNVIISALDVQEENYSRIKVYPNPVTSIITIDFSDTILQGEVLISNVNGILLNKNILNQQQKTTIDFNKYASGIYFLSIIDNQTKRNLTYKLIKK